MSTRTRRILVVDRDPGTVWGVGSCLTRDGCTVCTCRDGLEAIELLSSNRYDFLITDIRLPRLNGLSVIDWVRENRPSLKVIVMTDFDSPAVRKLCLSKGAILYLEKPVDTALLKGVISAYEDTTSFSGSVDEIDILDYVQLMMLTGRQIVLEVLSKEGERGLLFINKGQIVHAECGELEAKEAVFKCLGFAGGSFVNRSWREPRHISIEGSGEFLLIEAARLRDEARRKTQVAVG